MKRSLLIALAGAVLVGAVALSQPSDKPTSESNASLQITSEGRNPWTHLRLNNKPDDFQFVVVSDRTGGHREKIFSKAVEQINMLQPEFVLSVGDLIEGYSTDREKVLDQWREFQTFTHRLQMPFFYVPGNHDVTNPDMEKIWIEKFGRRYYEFVYKGVLFLILNSDDPPGSSGMSEAQVTWAKQVLENNKAARWTIVAFHKPVWHGKNESNGWGEIEKALNGRNYTVFVGHEHRYVKAVRNGMNYYQLATTGGGSKLRGTRYGEFDHITWVTMKPTGPVLANLMLDGIMPENLVTPDTVEPVPQYDRKPTHPVTGVVYIDGAPAANATVSFYLKDAGAKKGPRFTGDGLIEGDGSFRVSSYTAYDGLPAGEYLVTVSYDGRYARVLEKTDRKDSIPAAYRSAATTPLTAVIKAGKNDLTLEVKSEGDVAPPVTPKEKK